MSVIDGVIASVIEEGRPAREGWSVVRIPLFGIRLDNADFIRNAAARKVVFAGPGPDTPRSLPGFGRP